MSAIFLFDDFLILIFDKRRNIRAFQSDPLVFCFLQGSFSKLVFQLDQKNLEFLSIASHQKRFDLLVMLDRRCS